MAKCRHGSHSEIKRKRFDALRQGPCADPIDPRAFRLAKAAYAVGETLDLLSIGRTSLYAAVKRGDLKCVKFGKKTLFYAADLASFLTLLRRMGEAKADRVGRAAAGG
jgi:hypothetical protein